MNNSKSESFKIQFNIKYNVSWGEVLNVCGSIPELGGWDGSKAVRMISKDDRWTAEIEIPTSRSYFEYKYIVSKEGMPTKWEEGPNRPFFSSFAHVAQTSEIWDSWGSSSALSALQTQAGPSVSMHDLRVMTYNIRYDTPLDGRFIWENRKSMVTSVIRFHRADIIGLQEPLAQQLDDILSQLKNFGSVGVGREDGKKAGEYAPILYNKTIYELRDSGCFWVSETPDVPGSKSWKTSCTRICSWACLKPLHGVTKDLCTFYVFNTHLDHDSLDARKNGIKLILRKMHEITQNSYPIIFTGDLNAIEAAEEIKWITSPRKDVKLVFKNCKELSENSHHGPTNTFTGFDLQAKSTIDYIFLQANGSKCKVKVLQHGVAADIWDNKVPPSDHRPVIADLSFVPLS